MFNYLQAQCERVTHFVRVVRTDLGSTGWSSVAVGQRRMLLLLWVIFLIRAVFYLSVTPMWEGFDEHSHFAYVQLMSVEGRLPVAARDRISREVHSSLKLAPLPLQPGGFGLGSTHDDYWRLDEADRNRRQTDLRALDLSSGRKQTAPDPSNPFIYVYQGQHPPLYYALCLIPYRLAEQLDLVDRVFLIRAFSVLIASGLIPLAFFLLRHFLDDFQALLVVWIIAFLPGLMFDVVRVGNESLGVLLFTLLVLLCVRGVRSRTGALVIGILLGLGLMTKSSFMTAVIPAGIALLLPLRPDRPLRRRLEYLGLAGLATLAVSGWWYLLNYWVSGNWTGLDLRAGIQEWSLTSAARSVDWPNAFKTILSSHIWFGNWSYLKLRSWMYQLVMIAFLIGMVGAAIRLMRNFIRSVRNRYAFMVAVLFYVFFWVGLCYYTMLTHVATGVPAIGGWYLHIAIGCEMVVMFAGLTFFLSKGSATKVTAAAALGSTLMDSYGVFFLLIPYYTGFISHDARGSLSSFKPWTLSLADYAEMFSRLTANKPGFMTQEYFLGLAAVFVLIGFGSILAAVRFLLPEKRYPASGP